jgi:hypothetical protein
MPIHKSSEDKPVEVLGFSEKGFLTTAAASQQQAAGNAAFSATSGVAAACYVIDGIIYLGRKTKILVFDAHRLTLVFSGASTENQCALPSFLTYSL